LDRRISPLGDGVEWRVTCFVTVVSHRRRCVAGLALRGAIDAIRASGGGVIEGYSERMIPDELALRSLNPGSLLLSTAGLLGVCDEEIHMIPTLTAFEQSPDRGQGARLSQGAVTSVDAGEVELTHVPRVKAV
jgi:hypothetical protein